MSRERKMKSNEYIKQALKTESLDSEGIKQRLSKGRGFLINQAGNN
jgi:hypothetical protein